MQPDVRFRESLFKPSQATPCVFVIDDDASVRESLEQLLDGAGWAVETYACAEDFLARPAVSAPTCLVSNMALPDVTASELQERVSVHRVSTPVVFVTGRVDIPMTVRAMKAGAVELLVKPLRDEVLLEAVAQALDKSAALLGQEAELRTLRQRHACLTRRERQVLVLVVAGRLNKHIAADLEISEITVKAHRGKVMHKMNARSLPDLVRMAGKLGIA